MTAARKPCDHCRVLEVKIASLEAEIASVRVLLAKSKKTSVNSSKPPSSDIVKPINSAAGANGKVGGQPGHPMHSRMPFSATEITARHTHAMTACPRCGGEMKQTEASPIITQQVDIEKVPLKVEEHIQPEFQCVSCGKHCRAPMPIEIIRGGLVGSNLTALIAFMKGGCHASYSTIRIFLRDVVGVTVGRSTLVNTIEKVTEALDAPYEELLKLLPSETNLNVDETGHKCKKDLWWTWCLRADLYTLFKIDAHRSADVLLEILGAEFQGVLGCDYFSAYRKYMRLFSVTVQFCLAHLIRDVKFLTTLPDAATKAYGEAIRLALKQLFEVFHGREQMTHASFDRALKQARDRVLRLGQENVPATKHAQNMAKRFAKHGASFFTFVTTPGIEPTNNLAEQAIRFVVIDRHITQGTRSESGRRWSERIWTAIATCANQNRSAHDYLSDCVRNWFSGLPSPSLLNEKAAS